MIPHCLLGECGKLAVSLFVCLFFFHFFVFTGTCITLWRDALFERKINNGVIFLLKKVNNGSVTVLG